MRDARELVPWDYLDVVRRYLRPTDRVLDIGTGGGEKLFSLVACFDSAVGVDISPEWLLDRVGRKWLLGVCYLGGATALAVLAVATSLFHFGAASILLSIVGSVVGGIGSALVTDLVPQESLGKGLSWFSTMGWMGGIVGYASTGYTIQNLGMVPGHGRGDIDAAGSRYVADTDSAGYS